MSDIIESLEVVAAGKSAATDEINSKKLLKSMLETRKLLKICNYNKAIINSQSNKMLLICSDNTTFEIAVDGDYDDDNNAGEAGEDEDDNYYYDFSGQEDEDSEGDEKTNEVFRLQQPQRQKRPHINILKNEEEEEENDEKDKEKPISEFAIKMGYDLHVLLEHIDKLPSPPPTNNVHVLSGEDYRKALINRLKGIKSTDEFTEHESIFVPIIPSSRRKGSLSFILNEEDDDDDDGSQKMSDNSDYEIFEHQININLDDPIINRDVVAKINDPSSLLSLPIKEFESEKEVVCTIITNIIIRIYNTSLKDQLSNEIIRRREFRHHVLFYDYYEKLSVYCNLFKERPKGKTIKSQAIEMIVRSSKPSSQDPPRITSAAISTVLNKAFRIKRLLAIASDNYNIINAFPDLGSYLFTAKKMGVINFERWLELVKTGKLITFKEGKQKYERSKAIINRERAEILRNVYQNKNR
ncbi:hypothetical protein RhiirA4_510525 [Rhizophagus irregularis]|uniref:Uncharacterized protein n=1 Tax=Rhizophagus irregularis TaxID=588596 RepID=A0A2I1HFM3_9GLOM|nr:hypothetical protein RhiirA4_510525 [Rhizophagus irregularis]